MRYLYCFIAAIVIFAFTTILYRLLSKGLSASAKGQQLTRFGIGALLAVLPTAIAGVPDWNITLSLITITSLCVMLVYPLTDWLSSRHTRTEIDNRMDFALGLYLAGFLCSVYYSLSALLGRFAPVVHTLMAAVELIFVIVIIFEIVYYAIYRTAVDHDGLKLVLDTDLNESLEFIRSFPTILTLGGSILTIFFIIVWFMLNLASSAAPSLNVAQTIGELVCCALFCRLMFKGNSAAFKRAALPRFYFESKSYAREVAGYGKACEERMKNLSLTSPLLPAAPADASPERDLRNGAAAGKDAAPGRTYILVIGESASRDYMEAFVPTSDNAGTTPWLSAMVGEGSALIFPNAYSCHFQTVPTLTRALTSYNQYEPGNFVDAISIVDVAHKLGMKVYWFSNQGHIGQNDTPVTLIAETADMARWTSQVPGRVNYDGELVDMLAQTDTGADKLIVLHLMGSHFTYSNRYPAQENYFQFDPANGVAAYTAAYRNSIRYTDSVLHSCYDYAIRNLNLQAMVYCSDHADLPDRRRSPVFDGGVCKLRIPLVLFASQSYRKDFGDVLSQLKENADRPFSNDLLFNFVCGLWKVRSDVAPEKFNLASPQYSLTAETTKLLLGETTISADPSFGSRD